MSINPNDPLTHNDPAVLQHMDMFQAIISRMAANSAACKNWCIVLVSAFFAFVVEKGLAEVAWIGAFPILLFWFLDANYLGLERKFREAANFNVQKIHAGNFLLTDLFVVNVDGKLPIQWKSSFFSWSTAPVYIVLLLMLWLAMTWSQIPLPGKS